MGKEWCVDIAERQTSLLHVPTCASLPNDSIEAQSYHCRKGCETSSSALLEWHNRIFTVRITLKAQMIVSTNMVLNLLT